MREWNDSSSVRKRGKLSAAEPLRHDCFSQHARKHVANKDIRHHPMALRAQYCERLAIALIMFSILETFWGRLATRGNFGRVPQRPDDWNGIFW